jgi:uncharacterized membrane protein YbhN (UPF0104 family)
MIAQVLIIFSLATIFSFTVILTWYTEKNHLTSIAFFAIFISIAILFSVMVEKDMAAHFRVQGFISEKILR